MLPSTLKNIPQHSVAKGIEHTPSPLLRGHLEGTGRHGQEGAFFWAVNEPIREEHFTDALERTSLLGNILAIMSIFFLANPSIRTKVSYSNRNKIPLQGYGMMLTGTISKISRICQALFQVF